MEQSEVIQDGLEKAHEEESENSARMGRVRRIAAIVLTVLGGVGVVCSMQANDAQTEYLAKTTELANTWAQYQGKSDRRAIDIGVAEIERHLPNATDPTIIADAQRRSDEAARMQADPVKLDGMSQLAARAHEIEAERTHEQHLHDRVELGTRIVELCAMVTGLSLAVESIGLLVVAATAGILGAAYSIAASAGIF